MTPSTAPMPSPAAKTRYDGVAIGLHWLLALLIIGAFCMGLYMTSLPFSPQRLKLFSWHKWAGISILGLSALRLLWRLTHRPPQALPGPAWQVRAAHLTHRLMYLLFFAIPLVGWLYTSAAGVSVVLFGVLPLPDLVAPDKALADSLKPLHAVLAFALAGLVALHVLATLKHQLIDHDGLLRRMWPGRQ